MKDDTHSTSFVSMSKKWGVKIREPIKRVIKRVKLESYGFANKTLIFASIFKNFELLKAYLSYESADVFKFYLQPIGAAQYGSEN